MSKKKEWPVCEHGNPDGHCASCVSEATLAYVSEYQMADACKSDLERVVEYYVSQFAGNDPPWSWGAERALYSRQLQDANKRIHELEAELRKMREDMRKLMHAAAHPPQIQEEPVAFPARALRFSI